MSWSLMLPLPQYK
uniref:Uncharacterized protein n=1 Tax=Arundo donax TaxID=35708 RepID=A0A0A9FTD2_ARUDO